MFIVLLVVELAPTGPGEQKTVLYGNSVELCEAGDPRLHLPALTGPLSVLEESFSLGSFIFVVSPSARSLLLPLQSSQFLSEKFPSSTSYIMSPPPINIGVHSSDCIETLEYFSIFHYIL